jgi:hypothetical protein
MKNLLSCKSLIKVAIMIVVIALIGSQMMDTEAGRGKKRKNNSNNTSGGGSSDQEVCCDEILAKLDQLLDGNGDCPEPGECPGAVPKTGNTINNVTEEDGNLLKGVAWPNPRFTVNSDGTVTDNLTCLIWDPDADRFGQQTWPNALNACDTSTFGGHTDWRLPNIRELQSLLHYGVDNPAVPDTLGTSGWTTNGDPFSNVQSSNYWSSTTSVSFTTNALLVWFGNGNVGHNVKDFSVYVWCVRGGP